MKDPLKISTTSSVFTLTGHKDDKIARPAAEKLARELREVAVVVAGVHIERANREDIKILVKNSAGAINELKKKLKDHCVRVAHSKGLSCLLKENDGLT